MCKQCKVYIDLNEINDHKQYHEALTIMGFKNLPDNEEILKDRRVNMLKVTQIKYLKKSQDFNSNKAYKWNLRVKQINYAFELLKSYVNNTFEIDRRLSNIDLKLDAYGS
jgi:hypothetical protein